MSKSAINSLYGDTSDRNQSIFTPAEILEIPMGLWGRIAMDPCASTDAVVDADEYLYEEDDGLSRAWPPYAFCNPPWRYLKKWMRHADEQPEHMMFCPVRPNRKYWRDYACGKVVFYLNPVTFVGYDQSYPGPTCLIYSGVGTLNRCEFVTLCKESGLGGFLH